MEYWGTVGSITIISLLLKRSPSSVQTRASRLGLPRRDEVRDRHRRRWTEEDEVTLNEAIEKYRLADGRIAIDKLASATGRSIDAIAARLSQQFQSGDELLASIALPVLDNFIKRKAHCDKQARQKEPPQEKVIPDTRKQGKMRKCLSCQKSFWSEGAHNRICNTCKKNDDGGWDWD